jgi:hypothetical protein
MAPSLKVKSYEPSELSEIRYAYEDGYLTDEEATSQLIAKGLADTEDEAYWIIRKWEAGDGYSRYDAIYDAVRNGGSINAEMAELTSHGYAEEEIIGKIKSKIREWFKGGEISTTQATNMYTKYAGMTSDEAAKKVKVLSLIKAHPILEDVSDTAIANYATYCEPHGISAETFYNVYVLNSSADADTDYNGNAISGSKKAKVLGYINSLSLSYAQKDSLYYAFGWAASKIHDAPWH